MAAPVTVNEFLHLLNESQLVEPAAIAHQMETWPSVPAEPRGLAARLLQEGLLTDFQAEHLLQGHYRGFTVGKYRILKQLGSGSGGTVYLCEQPGMDRLVAVKVLPFPRDPHTSTVERFRREARALASLDHPNIVHVHDFDQDGSKLFLVMEHIEGTSLRSYVRSVGRLDPLTAAHTIRQAARGLHAMHEAGLVHRDVKPGNMMLDPRGNLKILDLGLARFLYEESDSLTVMFDNGRVLGTPEYLSPEQAANSHEVDIRADVYSLGATFYFCLTGQPPFVGGTIPEKLIWVQTRSPRPIHELNPDAPPPLVELVERMMARDPADRPQQPIEVVNALAPWTQSPADPPQLDLPPSPKPRSRILRAASSGEREPQPTQMGGRTTRTTHAGIKLPTHPGIKLPTKTAIQLPTSAQIDVPAKDPGWIDNTLGPTSPHHSPRPQPAPESRLGQLAMVAATVLLSVAAGVAVCWLLTTGGW